MALLLTAACRQQVAPPVEAAAPEKAPGPDGQVVAARQMTAEQVSALETAAAKDRQDVNSRARLLAYYSQGSYIPETRRLMLWMIANHPEGIRLGDQLYRPIIDSGLDPEGYQEGRKLWLARLVHHDLPVEELNNAAAYFKLSDPTISQKLIMRASVKDNDQKFDLGVAYYEHLADGPAWKWLKPLGK